MKICLIYFIISFVSTYSCPTLDHDIQIAAKDTNKFIYLVKTTQKKTKDKEYILNELSILREKKALFLSHILIKHNDKTLKMRYLVSTTINELLLIDKFRKKFYHK